MLHTQPSPRAEQPEPAPAPQPSEADGKAPPCQRTRNGTIESYPSVVYVVGL